MSSLTSIEEIKHTFYINLASRQDRKEHIESQLKNMGLTNVERFNAIKLKDGRVGCSMSHLKCLELAKERRYEHVLICEDDTLFVDPETFKKQFKAFFAAGRRWDVLLFAGNNMPPFERVDESCVRVSYCQTTTCYLVNGHYIDTLLTNIRNGLNLLMHNPALHFYYAIDKYWIELQKRDQWFIITPLTVIQREDYSDIEQRRTNYGHIMLDLDKTKLIAKMLEKQKRLT